MRVVLSHGPTAHTSGRINDMADNADEDEYIPVTVVKMRDLLAVEAPTTRAQLEAIDFGLDEGD
jgi:hypothetical protein